MRCPLLVRFSPGSEGARNDEVCASLVFLSVRVSRINTLGPERVAFPVFEQLWLSQPSRTESESDPRQCGERAVGVVPRTANRRWVSGWSRPDRRGEVPDPIRKDTCAFQSTTIIVAHDFCGRGDQKWHLLLLRRWSVRLHRATGSRKHAAPPSKCAQGR
jgi:hypothetical protein